MAVRKQPISRTLKKLETKKSVKTYPKTVTTLKKQYRNLPLHFLFGIESEIDHQCSILDDYLEKLEEIKSTLKRINHCQNLELAKVHAAQALYQLQTLPKEIDETTRSNFESLRRAHDGWKQLAIKAIDHTQEPTKFLKVF